MKHMKHFFYYAFTCCIILSVYSCDDNDEPTNGTTPQPPVTAQNLVTLTYDNFITENDVTILSPDTTNISISKELLTQNSTQITHGDVICIWQKINSIPFIRIVDEVSDNGSNINITTSPGDISDVFSDADLNLSSEIYVNSLQSNGNQYICPDNEYHPVVVLWNSPDNGVQGSQNLQYITAEEIMSRSIRWGAERTFHPYAKIGNDESYIELNGEIITRLGVDIDISIKWFKLKNFNCTFTGEIDANLPIALKTSAEYTVSKEIELCKIPSYTFVFWVSAVPVAVTLDSSLYFEAKAQVNAECGFELPVDFYYRYQRGTSYTSSNGWNTITNDVAPTFTCDMTNLIAKGSIESSASASLMFKTGLYLYGIAGPYLELEPTMTAEASISGEASAGNGNLKLATSGKVSIDGTIGAEFKVLKWTLSKQIFPFTIYSTELWNWEREYNIN